MRKLIFFLFFSTTLFLTGVAQVSIQWATRDTSSGSNVDRAEDMSLDTSGNIYVTGIGVGSSSGNFDYITIKYNSAGVQQWKAEYNGLGNGLDDAHAIVVDDSNNVYVTGWSYGGGVTGFDYATVKYNSAGVQQWVARYNNTTNGTDEASDIGVDKAGNVYVTGSSGGSGTNSAATSIKYNAAGVQQYIKRFEGVGGYTDAGHALYVEPVSGTLYVTGYTYQSASSDFDYITLKYNTAGTQQWVSRYNGPDDNYDEARAIAVDTVGNVYVTGYSQTAILTNYDYATVKYNSAGIAQWTKRYNGTGNDYDRANAIKVDAVGNIYVTGKSVGAGSAAEDMLTIKYNNNGIQKWIARYNGDSNGYDESKALTIDASGNIYITGYSYAATSGNDYTTIKYDSAGSGANGVQLWIAKYNGSGNNVDQAAAIIVDTIGNVFITGLSKGGSSNEDFVTIKYCQLSANAGNDDTICIGTNTTLSASALGAVSYVWTPNNGTLSSQTSPTPVATPTVTTSYIVTITNANGCVDSDTVLITVSSPSSTITSSNPAGICAGDSIELTVATNVSYQWSTSSSLQSITVLTSGTYTVIVTNTNGCTATGSITVVETPSIPTIYRGNDTLYCTQTATSYKWYRNGIVIPDATNKYYVFIQNGTYYVEVFNVSGCSVVSTTITVMDISIGEINASALLAIYPNPTTNNVTLELNLVKASDVKIYLTNMSGQLVFTENLSQFTGTLKKQINLSQNAKGIYYLQIITNDQVINRKVVKQ